MMGNRQKLDKEGADMVIHNSDSKYLKRSGAKKKIKRRIHKAARKESFLGRIDESIMES